VQLAAAGSLVAFAFLLIGLDRVFDFYGLAAFGGMVIAFVGTRVMQTGLTLRENCCVVTIQTGEIPVGFLIMLIGAIVLISSFNKYRTAI